VKDENGDLLADSHIILNRWKNYFSQLLNVHRAEISEARNSHCRATGTLLISAETDRLLFNGSVGKIPWQPTMRDC
jgi:hypothetical protein